MTITTNKEEDIRKDEVVRRCEQVIRDGMSEAPEPLEWLFGPDGRLASARLGGARVRAAIEQRHK